MHEQTQNAEFCEGCRFDNYQLAGWLKKLNQRVKLSSQTQLKIFF